MISTFPFFIKEISKPKSLRKGISSKRKQRRSYSVKRINELFDRYFSKILPGNERFVLTTRPEDYQDLVYLLRVHFQLWIDIQGNNISIYRKFPEIFRLTKDVNTTNHLYTPLTIPAGTIMELAADPYGVVNFDKGIPLTGKILSENESKSNTSKPYLQINYSFIETISNVSKTDSL